MTIARAWLKRLLAATAWLAGALIIVLALSSLALRLALPHADGLRDEVSAGLATLLGLEVEMGALDARLYGLTPVLTLHDARLLEPDSGQPLLGLRELRITPDLLASLRARQPRIAGITLVGAELGLRRFADGRIGIRGLDALAGGDDPSALAFFLREGRIGLADSTLFFRDEHGALPDLGLVIERLDFVNAGRDHRLRLRAYEPGAPLAGLQLLARFDGPARAPTEWSGTLYLDWQVEQLPHALRALLPADLRLTTSGGRLRAWIDVDRGQLRESLAALSIDDVRLKREDVRSPVPPPALTAAPDNAPRPIPRPSPLPSARPDATGTPTPATAAVTAPVAAAAARLDFDRIEALLRLRTEPHGWRLEIADLVLAPPGTNRRPQDAGGQRQAGVDPAQQPQSTDVAVILSSAPANPRPSVVSQPELGLAEPVAPAPATLTVGSGPIALAPLAALAGFLTPWVDADLPPILTDLLNGPVHGTLASLAFRLAPRPTAAVITPPTPFWTPLLTPAADMDPGPDRSPGSNPDPAPDWRMQARITDLGLPAGGPWPALAGVALDLDAGPVAGTLDLAAHDLTLDLRPRLAMPTPLERLEGRLHWRRGPGDLTTVWAPSVRADTAHVSTDTRVRLTLGPTGTRPFIDLHARLTDGDLAHADALLPVSNMDPKLVAWLERALVGGRLDRGDILLHGALADFPFDHGTGRFLLDLRASAATLDYAPARDPDALGLTGAERARALPWPPLEDLAATLRIDGRALAIDVADGRLLATSITGGQATLPNLWQPRMLAITARGHGPLTDGLRVLAETPASQQLGGIADGLIVSGSGDLALALGVPLRRDLKFDYDGTLTVAGDASVEPKGTGLLFTGVTGPLRFDPTGVHADALRGTIDGQAIGVGITSPAGQTEIAFTGNTTIDELARRWPNPLWGLATGRLDWRLLLTLRHADLLTPPVPTAGRGAPPMAFALTSDLRGVALTPPAPLGKAAGASMPLTGALDWDGQWPLRATLRIGTLGAAMELARNAADGVRLSRIAIDPSALPTTLPTQPGILIDGSTETLVLDDWIPWLAANSSRLAGSGPTAVGGSDTGLALLPMRLRAGQMTLGPLDWREVDTAISPERGGGFAIRVTTATGNGRVDLPAAGSAAPLRVQLDTLDVAPLWANPAPGEARANGNGDPRALPGLTLTIDRLMSGAQALGRLHAVTEARADGVHLRELSLDGALLDASGSGAWTRDATGFRSTAIALEGRSSDLGTLLRSNGVYSELAGAAADVTLSLNWPGGPNDLKVARLRGNIGATIGAGRLLDIDPGVGRMLGIMNLGALRRRLSLDFRDVFDTGFRFDTIQGEIAIGGGSARISDLKIRAAAADIHISGTADLASGNLNQNVRVTPQLGTGLAIAGTVAGGPLVGAAMLLVDRATGGPVDRLARIDYRITGPWRDPQVQRVGGPLPISGTGSGTGTGTSSGTGSGTNGNGTPARRGNGNPSPAQTPTQTPTPARPTSPFLNP